MENDIYNQNEVKFFTDVYNYLKNTFRCDISGNISAQDTHEFLLVSSKLSKDIILRIGEITGGTVQGWYGEKQFFFALKLVAAAQQGIPLTSQIPFIEIDLQLPELFTNNNTEYDRPKSKEGFVREPKCGSSPNLINLSDSDCPPPKASDNGYQIMISEDPEDEYPVEGMYSEPTSNFTSQSPSVSSPASDSPTPTNSGHEKHWNQPINSQWHIIVNEEHHQLLGTEEESSDRHSSEEKEDDEEGVESEKEVIDKDKEETELLKEEEQEADANDDDDDVWTITEEQQQYYTRQFTTMQPDMNGFLPGNVAKQFFEKSKLPVAELRQIWQLSDVSRDGALSLEEFFAAMHLVVLRRNKIPLPDKLPKALLPKSFRWTKFMDSPTSTLSSPGPKPVNFDFQKGAVEKDPKILHPTPLRVTPEAKRHEASDEVALISSQERECEGSTSRNPYSLNMASTSFSFEEERNVGSYAQPKLKVGPTKSCIGPMQTLRNIEDCGSTGSTSLPPFSPITHTPTTTHSHPPTHLKDIPPPPPPRPSRTHVRSSSLDLNKFNKVMAHKSPPPVTAGSPNVLLKKQSDNGVPLPPPWEPRISNVHEEGAATATHLRNSVSKHNHSSAFEVYKKPLEEECSKEAKSEILLSEEDEDEASQLTSISVRQSDKRDILSSLQTMREKNSVLQRLNSELNQELAEVIEERIALEYQLEQMKSFST